VCPGTLRTVKPAALPGGEAARTPQTPRAATGEGGVEVAAGRRPTAGSVGPLPRWGGRLHAVVRVEPSSHASSSRAGGRGAVDADGRAGGAARARHRRGRGHPGAGAAGRAEGLLGPRGSMAFPTSTRLRSGKPCNGPWGSSCHRHRLAGESRWAPGFRCTRIPRCTAMTDKALSACAGTYHRVNCSRRRLAHFLSP
jgi:hypothetical protein